MSVKHSTNDATAVAGPSVAGPTIAGPAASAPAVAGFSAAEAAAMEAALAAALRGPRGANPLVGAVVIAPDGTQLVTGYHRGAGTAHAEADAIDQAKAAGHDLSGTT
ncbi:MAG TPA: riboflavin biosynthesis protein RibD, partial [Arthrobacter sp.]|nr:riboflavin biosynthesis protein RibD [Arthrobacter sp.]